MTKVVIDAAVQNQLGNLAQPLEIYDASGRMLGMFTPVPATGFPEPQLSEEELQRRDQDGQEFSTAEVLAYLEKL